MDYVVRCMFGMSNADFKKFAATINWNKTSQQRAVGFPGFIGNIIKHLDEFDFVQQRTRDGKPKMMPSADKVPELLLQVGGLFQRPVNSSVTWILKPEPFIVLRVYGSYWLGRSWCNAPPCSSLAPPTRPMMKTGRARQPAVASRDTSSPSPRPRAGSK